jgi:endonuclease YncB( thermonuclease family)
MEDQQLRAFSDMRLTCFVLVVALLGLAVVAPGQENKPGNPDSQVKVVRELVSGERLFEGENILRITGKVKVIDAGTLAFEDGAEVEVAGTIDAPALEQKGFIGDAFYSWGKEAAEFLRKLIGDQPVTFYTFGGGQARREGKLRGRCFIGEMSLAAEMVRNGWALAHHSNLTPYEIIARENKRGVWRGKFITPERWRKGERLPGE